MATLTYFIRTTKKGKKAKIRARLRHNEEYLYAKTNYSIEPENWDKKRQRIKQGKSHSVRDTINNSLSSLETNILDLWNIQNDKSLLDSEWLQHKINLYFKLKSKVSKESQEVTFIGFVSKFINSIDEYVDRKTGRKLAERTIQKHKRAFEVLNDFVDEKHSGILLKDINYQFYEDFLKYLTNKKGFAVNTVGKYIASLKMFLNQAKKIGVFIDLDGFTKLSEVSNSVHLNEKELLKIYEYDFSQNKRLERVRDLFIVGCWTGLRFSDLTSLTKDIIKEDKIIENIKTGNVVPIPLFWMTTAILEKYEYNLPVDITNQKFNKYIKEVCDAAEINKRIKKSITKGGKREYETFLKHELITAHTARRSFATNLYNSGFPYISIMALTGHKSLNSFLAYIKVTPEEHAKKVEEHWAKADKTNKIYAESLD